MAPVWGGALLKAWRKGAWGCKISGVTLHRNCFPVGVLMLVMVYRLCMIKIVTGVLASVSVFDALEQKKCTNLV